MEIWTTVNQNVPDKSCNRVMYGEVNIEDVSNTFLQN